MMWPFLMGPNHSLKLDKNLRGQGKFLVDLTWNDPTAASTIRANEYKTKLNKAGTQGIIKYPWVIY